MHVSPTNTLAEIVSSNPQAAIVFEKYRLDFCCKGKRTLVEACQEKSIQPAKILYELQSTIEERANDGPISSFETNSLSELIKYIQEKHHLFTKNELSRLMVYLEKIADKHGTRHPELVRILQLFGLLKIELLNHLAIEDEELFPQIIQLELFSITAGSLITTNTDSFENNFKSLEQDHNKAGEFLSEIRDLTRNYCAPADACTTYKLAFASIEAFERDLHQHIHLENNILFPRAMALLKKGTRFSE